MLIFSVSFQFFRMHPRREQLLLGIYGRPKQNFQFCSSRGCDCGWSGRVTLRAPRRGGTQVTPERTLDPSHRVMSSYDIAEKIRESLPGTEEIIVQYLSGYLVDEASEDEDILQVARYMLESVAVDKPDVLEQLTAGTQGEGPIWSQAAAARQGARHEQDWCHVEYDCAFGRGGPRVDQQGKVRTRNPLITSLGSDVLRLKGFSG